jgi:tetratricopeptide (TPR) repeat protein
MVPTAPPGSLRHLVERYLAGDRQDAVAGLDRWDGGSLKREVKELLATAGYRVVDPQHAERLILAATMLHTDRALLDRENGARASFELQLEMAWSWVKLGLRRRDCAGCPGFARRWYLAAGLILQFELDLMRARPFLLEGIERFSDDPRLLLALGSTDEALASRRLYEPPRDALTRRGAAREHQGERFHRESRLREAESRYRKALAADPGLVEARLRLGRVLSLTGRTAEAAAELEKATAGARAPSHRYLSRLFLGDVREAQGDLPGAAESYRQAAAVVDSAQTAHLALGRALDILGDHDGAQRALERAAPRGSRVFTPDPWWRYPYGQIDELDPLLDELRAAVRP